MECVLDCDTPATPLPPLLPISPRQSMNPFHATAPKVRKWNIIDGVSGVIRPGGCPRALPEPPVGAGDASGLLGWVLQCV